MDAVSKSYSPVTLRCADGSELTIPDELFQVLSFCLSCRLMLFAVDAFKKILLSSPDEM